MKDEDNNINLATSTEAKRRITGFMLLCTLLLTSFDRAEAQFHIVIKISCKGNGNYAEKVKGSVLCCTCIEKPSILPERRGKCLVQYVNQWLTYQTGWKTAWKKQLRLKTRKAMQSFHRVSQGGEFCLLQFVHKLMKVSKALTFCESRLEEICEEGYVST